MSETTVATTAPTRAQFKPLGKVESVGELLQHPQFAKRIAESLPTHLKPDWMLSTFIQCVNRTPKLAKASPLSLAGAFMTCASVGMVPNSSLGEVHLIPFDVNKYNPSTKQREFVRTDVQVIFGYQGLLALARRSGLVTSVHCDVVWANDVRTENFSFEYGTNKHLKHRPTGVHIKDETPIYAYAWVRLKDGDDQFYVMPWSDVMVTRNRTQAYRTALKAAEDAAAKGWKQPAAYTEAPWIKFPEEMAKKTAFRALAKWLPKSAELAAALEIEDVQDREGSVRFASIIEGTSSIIDGGFEAIEQATADGEPAETPQVTETERPAAPAEEKPAELRPPQQRQQRAAREAAPQRQTAARPAQQAPQAAAAPPAQEEPPPPAGEHEYGGESPVNAPVQQPTQQQAPAEQAVDYYLLDEDSNLVEGEAAHTRDPVVFAERFITAWRASARPMSLVEANANAIQDARKASRDATTTLAEMERKPEPAVSSNPPPDSDPEEDTAGLGDGLPAPDPQWFIAMPKNANGVPNYPGYVLAVRRMLASITVSEDLVAFERANQDEMEAIDPVATRTAVRRAMDTRRGELLAQEPAAVVDRDMNSARARVEEINACKSADELTAYAGGTMIKTLLDRFDRERPELSALIRDAAKAKREALAAAKV